MGFWNRDKDYKPWDWNPDRDDPDKNGRNDEFRESEEDKLFHQEKSEFEWNEIENRIGPDIIKNGLKDNKEIQAEYQRQTSGMATNLMMLQLTHWKFAHNNEAAKRMIDVARKLDPDGHTFDKMMNNSKVMEILRSNRRDDDSVNMSAMVAFGVALTDHCVNKDIQQTILSEYESQKKFFREKGELEYTAFLMGVETQKYFVEEMWLKEQVYKEIDELEKTPVPNDKK